MADSGKLPSLRGIAATWAEWVEVVRLFALRREQRFRLDHDEYHRLQARLLSAVRQSEHRDEAGMREFFSRMEELLTPWVTLEALHEAEPEILVRLLGHAHHLQHALEAGLGIAAQRRRVMRLVLFGGAVVAAAIAGTALWENWRAGLEWHRDVVASWTRGLLRAVAPVEPRDQVLLYGSLAALAAIVVVWMAARRR